MVFDERYEKYEEGDSCEAPGSFGKEGYIEKSWKKLGNSEEEQKKASEDADFFLIPIFSPPSIPRSRISKKCYEGDECQNDDRSNVESVVFEYTHPVAPTDSSSIYVDEANRKGEVGV